MNRANMLKWVEALESGKYTQGRSRLRQPDGSLCCLGVACEAAIENGVELIRCGDDYPDYAWKGYLYKQGASVLDSEEGELPEPVMEWLGLGSSNPVIAYGEPDEAEEGEILATEANDQLNWSFKRIATAVRKHYGL